MVQDVLDAGHTSATLHFTIRPRRKNREQPSPADGDLDNRKRRSVTGSDETGALLVVYTKDRKFFSKFSTTLRAKAADAENAEKSSRVKRGSGKHKIKGECRKVDFTVDFSVIGWDRWIIYPDSFTAYRCGGQCKSPLIQAHNPTNHAVLQSLMRKREKDSAPWPCCVPTKLRPIAMLYYEHDEIVLRKHENMVVDKCSCR